MDGALRVRAAHGDRLPRREQRHHAPLLVGLHDRHRPDRTGRLGHRDPACVRLRRDRERRRVGPAASRRPRRRLADAEAEAAADPRARRRLPAAHDAQRRRFGSGHGGARCDSGLRRGRQDGNGAEGRAERLHPRRLCRDLRRNGAGVAAAPPRACDDRRAARADLRRPRRGARLRADRLLRPAVPRSAAGSEDQVGG